MSAMKKPLQGGVSSHHWFPDGGARGRLVLLLRSFLAHGNSGSSAASQPALAVGAGLHLRAAAAGGAALVARGPADPGPLEDNALHELAALHRREDVREAPRVRAAPPLDLAGAAVLKAALQVRALGHDLGVIERYRELPVCHILLQERVHGPRFLCLRHHRVVYLQARACLEHAPAEGPGRSRHSRHTGDSNLDICAVLGEKRLDGLGPFLPHRVQQGSLGKAALELVKVELNE